MLGRGWRGRGSQAPAPSQQQERLREQEEVCPRGPKGRRGGELDSGEPVLRGQRPGGVSPGPRWPSTCFGSDLCLGRLPVTPCPGYQAGDTQTVEIERMRPREGTGSPLPQGTRRVQLRWRGPQSRIPGPREGRGGRGSQTHAHSRHTYTADTRFTAHTDTQTQAPYTHIQIREHTHTHRAIAQRTETRRHTYTLTHTAVRAGREAAKLRSRPRECPGRPRCPRCLLPATGGGAVLRPKARPCPRPDVVAPHGHSARRAPHPHPPPAGCSHGRAPQQHPPAGPRCPPPAPGPTRQQPGRPAAPAPLPSCRPPAPRRT